MQSMRFDGRAAGRDHGRDRATALQRISHNADPAPACTRRHARVPGDAADTRVIWYTHPGSKPVFADGLRVPAGYTESVLLTCPPYKTACVSARLGSEHFL